MMALKERALRIIEEFLNTKTTGGIEVKPPVFQCFNTLLNCVLIYQPLIISLLNDPNDLFKFEKLSIQLRIYSLQ